MEALVWVKFTRTGGNPSLELLKPTITQLTHYPLDKMVAIWQTISSDVFSWIKSFVFRWQQPSIGLVNGLMPNRRQAVIWTNADPVHWRLYAALEGDELTNDYMGHPVARREQKLFRAVCLDRYIRIYTRLDIVCLVVPCTYKHTFYCTFWHIHFDLPVYG